MRGVGPSILKGARSKNPDIANKNKTGMDPKQRKRKLQEAVIGLNCGCGVVYCPNEITTSCKCAICNIAFCSHHLDHELHTKLLNDYTLESRKINATTNASSAKISGSNSIGVDDDDENSCFSFINNQNNSKIVQRINKKKQKETKIKAVNVQHENKTKKTAVLLQKLNNVVSVVEEVNNTKINNTFDNSLAITQNNSGDMEAAVDSLEVAFNIILNKTSNNDVSRNLELLVERLQTALQGELCKKCTDFPLRIKNELDFPMYRCHYTELLEYFNIELPFDVLGSHDLPTLKRFKIEHVRTKFLMFFGKALADKLKLKNSGGTSAYRIRKLL